MIPLLEHLTVMDTLLVVILKKEQMTSLIMKAYLVMSLIKVSLRTLALLVLKLERQLVETLSVALLDLTKAQLRIAGAMSISLTSMKIKSSILSEPLLALILELLILVTQSD